MKIPRITSEVYQIGGPGLSAADDAAVYLVAIEDHAALIDAGCGSSVDQLLANVATCGVDQGQLHALFLTHCHFDHTGGAAEFQERLGLEVVMHALDAPYVEAADPEVTAAAAAVLLAPWTDLTMSTDSDRELERIVNETYRRGGIVIMPTESREASAALLGDTQMRRLLSLIETVATSGHVEVMATGEAIGQESATTMAVYEELGLL